jgi:ABC-type spermidine/putrescine transport system permease subunit II
MPTVMKKALDKAKFISTDVLAHGCVCVCVCVCVFVCVRLKKTKKDVVSASEMLRKGE